MNANTITTETFDDNDNLVAVRIDYGYRVMLFGNIRVDWFEYEGNISEEEVKRLIREEERREIEFN